MIEIKADHRHILRDVCNGIPGGHMPDAILQGYVGRAFTDDLDHPTVAILDLPQVHAIFLAGDMQSPAVAEYLNNLSAMSMIFVKNSAPFELLTQRIQRGKWVKQIGRAHV